jgi:hypothetical protein
MFCLYRVPEEATFIRVEKHFVEMLKHTWAWVELSDGVVCRFIERCADYSWTKSNRAYIPVLPLSSSFCIKVFEFCSIETDSPLEFYSSFIFFEAAPRFLHSLEFCLWVQSHGSNSHLVLLRKHIYCHRESPRGPPVPLYSSLSVITWNQRWILWSRCQISLMIICIARSVAL